LLLTAPSFARCLVMLIAAGSVGPSIAVRATPQQIEPGASAHAAVLGKYCITCHNDKSRTGGMSLEHADLADVPQRAETWERVIRKLRVGMMPPPGMPRPEPAQLDGLAAYLETALDRAAVE